MDRLAGRRLPDLPAVDAAAAGLSLPASDDLLPEEDGCRLPESTLAAAGARLAGGVGLATGAAARDPEADAGKEATAVAGAGAATGAGAVAELEPDKDSDPGPDADAAAGTSAGAGTEAWELTDAGRGAGAIRAVDAMIVGTEVNTALMDCVTMATSLGVMLAVALAWSVNV